MVGANRHRYSRKRGHRDWISRWISVYKYTYSYIAYKLFWHPGPLNKYAIHVNKACRKKRYIQTVNSEVDCFGRELGIFPTDRPSCNGLLILWFYCITLKLYSRIIIEKSIRTNTICLFVFMIKFTKKEL